MTPTQFSKTLLILLADSEKFFLINARTMAQQRSLRDCQKNNAQTYAKFEICCTAA